MKRSDEKRLSLSDVIARNPVELLNQKRLAQCLGRDVRSIRHMVRRNELPSPAKVGRDKVWIARKVLEHISERSDAATRAQAAEVHRLQRTAEGGA